MKRTAYVAVVFVALAGIIGFAVRSGPWGSNAQSSGGGGSVAAGSGGMEDRAVPAPLPAPAGDDSKLGALPLSQQLASSAVPGLGAEVIKDGRLSLQVKRNGLQERWTPRRRPPAGSVATSSPRRPTTDPAPSSSAFPRRRSSRRSPPSRESGR
jgi:hypothetical protein